MGMQQTFNYTTKLPKKKLETRITSETGVITNNRWVVYEGRIGIVTDLEENNATFKAVGEDGLTYASLPVNPYLLKLATLAQIPNSRKPKEEVAARLGYLLK